MSCKILTRGMLHLLVDVLVEGSALDFFRAKEVADASACHFRHAMTANQVNSHQGLNEAVKTNQAGWSTLSREEETLSSISTMRTLFSFIKIDLSGLRDLTSNPWRWYSWLHQPFDQASKLNLRRVSPFPCLPSLPPVQTTNLLVDSSERQPRSHGLITLSPTRGAKR